MVDSRQMCQILNEWRGLGPWELVYADCKLIVQSLRASGSFVFIKELAYP